MDKYFIDNVIGPKLAELREAALLRAIPDMDRGADKYITLAGNRLLNLASNNYLGFAGRPELSEAASEAAKAYGASSSASRLITGQYAPYAELERELARFKGTEAALVLGTGYMANLAAMALADRHTLVFSDRLNHASIIDGIRLSGAQQVRYRHNDMEHLAALLEKHRGHPRKILVTDTVFSMDGDVAPLGEIARICDLHQVLLVVDEAHATGIYGEGRGMAHEAGIAGRVDVNMGTFSKGLGSFGAYLAGKREIIDYIVNRGRSFIFTTALPPAVVGANLAAVRLAAADREPAKRLIRIAGEMREYLCSLGFDTGGSETQIIPVLLGESDAALRAREFLSARGMYVAAVRPPTVPQGTARLRLSLRADLTDKECAQIRAAFAALKEELAR